MIVKKKKKTEFQNVDVDMFRAVFYMDIWLVADFCWPKQCCPLQDSKCDYNLKKRPLSFVNLILRVVRVSNHETASLWRAIFYQNRDGKYISKPWISFGEKWKWKWAGFSIRLFPCDCLLSPNSPSTARLRSWSSLFCKNAELCCNAVTEK